MGDVIQIERTDEFVEIAKELSTLISSLPLNREQNDQLIDMIVKQVNSAEKAAFKQGFGLGLRYVEYGEEHPNET